MSDSLSNLNPVTARRAIRVLRPDSPDQAVSLARQFSASYTAGGTWLQPTHERDQCWPETLVALNSSWPGFRGLDAGPNGLTVGALTSLAELARQALIRDYLPPLAMFLNRVAGPGVRTLGTVGGNLIVGGDLSALAMALDVRVDVINHTGERALPFSRWLRERASDDLLRGFTIPDCRGWRISLEKLGYRERFSPTRATLACVHDGDRVRLAVSGEGGLLRLVATETFVNDRADLASGDVGAVIDRELAAHGWQDAHLRMALRRMTTELLSEVALGT
ncbi:FAD binding domain-containing protein [Marinobacter sp. F3R08]|uniref:FAD binding domain-containing protein n=1 Tax=Marinobacter sp. F3R08 TaxID=2841559 RepID=UPI001C08FF9A|nr:FAD binding domain-containing protein [Marinobacter sp. F3R08]MBU2954864.1 FAD binding domain-containing protein [Marinobacter sp. F3R08]